MADDPLTLADFVADAFDLSPQQVTDLSLGAPVLMSLPMEPSSNGTSHKYPKETGAPVVGFRAVNAGRDVDSSVDSVVSVDLKILDFSWWVDKALADAWRRGKDNLVAREGFRHLKSAFFEYEKQIIYGTGNAAAGFAGLAQNAAFDAAADALVVNAGGTTVSTGSSVWLYTARPDAMAAVMIEENPMELGETIVQDMIEAGTTKHFPVYYTPGTSWVGLQIGGAYDVVRIANLTEDSGKGLTDALIYTALGLFPGGRVPTHIGMNRRSLKQLRASRTATNATGAPAPIPREVEGIPIVVTEAILSTETLLA